MFHHFLLTPAEERAGADLSGASAAITDPCCENNPLVIQSSAASTQDLSQNTTHTCLCNTHTHTGKVTGKEHDFLCQTKTVKCHIHSPVSHTRHMYKQPLLY